MEEWSVPKVRVNVQWSIQSLIDFLQVIESDPEDDIESSMPKYPRGGNGGDPGVNLALPTLGTDIVSTPTYSMDTDISTLEAPTFSTLNQGPSQTMMMLRWDHPVKLIGKKVS